MQIHAATPFCLPLNHTDATLDRVGGKGASLAKLAAAGLPVPSGFLVTTAAYRRFVEQNGLQDQVARLAESAGDSPEGLEQASAAIRQLFADAPMPVDVAAALSAAYAALGEEPLPVAVRSSATAEDLPSLSFAGQQETYLNIRGEAALIDAVRRCWASLWTSRAIGYRNQMGIRHTTVAMGVVVQLMVPSEVSGVLFTANPTSGDREEMVINASFGLGEAIVSGQVTPDTYVLDKKTLRLKETVLGTKGVMIVPADGQGTAALEVPPARRSQQALSPDLLRELAGLALKVEELYGGVPQDIEWAVAGGRCWLLQARPITNLPPAPLRDVKWEPPRPGTAWIRRQVAEHMPEPLSPLFEELYLREGLHRMLDPLLERFGFPPALLREIMDPPLFATINGYAYQNSTIKKLRPSVVLKLAVHYLRTLVLAIRQGVAIWRDEAVPSYLAVIQRWKEVDLATASDEQLLEGVRELAHADSRYWYASALILGAARVTDAILDRFLARAKPGLSSALFLRGFPSKTIEAEVELAAIADRIRSSEELRKLVAATPAQRLPQVLAGTPLLADLQDYLDRYGHQIYNLDFAVPTQAEDPVPVYQSLKALVQNPDHDPRARLAEQARECARQTDLACRTFGPIRRLVFRWLLGLARKYAPYREDALFYVGAGWPTLRRMALELGRRLAAAGLLDRPDDVFYLETAELKAASAARAAGITRPDLARLARERRDLREARKRLQPPAAVPTDFRFKVGRIDIAYASPQQRSQGEGSTLRGFPVSPGVVTARASVILSPADFHKMEPGTILVCPTTTPAWTPLFAQAKGLVTEIGGVLAHGSIVAREYGIPAVMGVEGATRRIVNGQTVTVDGNTGVVIIHEEA